MTEHKEAKTHQDHFARGQLLTKTYALPRDANPSGDIFGGWLLSQMDMAAGIAAGQRAKSRVVTIAIESMTFRKPIYVGDVLCVYGEIVGAGRTSMKIRLEAWATRARFGDTVKVTEGTFTFVSVDDNGRPKELPRDRTFRFD